MIEAQDPDVFLKFDKSSQSPFHVQTGIGQDHEVSLRALRDGVGHKRSKLEALDDHFISWESEICVKNNFGTTMCSAEPSDLISHAVKSQYRTA